LQHDEERALCAAVLAAYSRDELEMLLYQHCGGIRRDVITPVAVTFEVTVFKHGQGDVPVPGLVEADLVAVQADLGARVIVGCSFAVRPLRTRTFRKVGREASALAHRSAGAQSPDFAAPLPRLARRHQVEEFSRKAVTAGLHSLTG
jgi:hypothetical protein